MKLSEKIERFMLYQTDDWEEVDTETMSVIENVMSNVKMKHKIKPCYYYIRKNGRILESSKLGEHEYLYEDFICEVSSKILRTKLFYYKGNYYESKFKKKLRNYFTNDYIDALM